MSKKNKVIKLDVETVNELVVLRLKNAVDEYTVLLEDTLHRATTELDQDGEVSLETAADWFELYNERASVMVVLKAHLEPEDFNQFCADTIRNVYATATLGSLIDSVLEGDEQV